MNVSVLFIATAKTEKTSVEKAQKVLDIFFKYVSDLAHSEVNCYYRMAARHRGEIGGCVKDDASELVLLICDKHSDYDYIPSVVTPVLIDKGYQVRQTVYRDDQGQILGRLFWDGVTQWAMCPYDPAELAGILQNSVGPAFVKERVNRPPTAPLVSARGPALYGQRDANEYARAAKTAHGAVGTRDTAGTRGTAGTRDTVGKRGSKAVKDTRTKRLPAAREPEPEDRRSPGVRASRSGKHGGRRPKRRLRTIDIFLRLLLVVSACAVVLFGYLFLSEKIDETTSLADYAQVARIAKAAINEPPAGDLSPGEISEGSASGASGASDARDAYLPVMRVDLQALREINGNVIGYVYIEGTKIDYPVVQAQDNTYYLHHSFMKKASAYGCVFLDSDAAITAGTYTQNLVLYGHRMKNGEMFGTLPLFLDLYYYRDHPLIWFNDAYRENVWKIFSVYIINTRAEHDSGDAFDYTQRDFPDDEAFMGFIKETKRRSVLNVPVDIAPGDHLLTLSTCDYSFPDARLVVVAKEVMTPEEARVDVARGRNNPFPLYPTIWYDNNGGNKPTEQQMHVASDVY
ncbi:MAG: class B sortase [Oscillospiraceae bacterium]|nr:class B sortase [Oscillospiraceae bacterium]